MDGIGDVYFVDAVALAVDEILAVNGSIPASPTIRTVGTLSSGFSDPTGVAVDGSGNVYIANCYDEPTIYEENYTSASSLSFASTVVGRRAARRP